MASQSAEVIDLAAYRRRRSESAGPVLAPVAGMAMVYVVWWSYVPVVLLPSTP